MTKTGIIRKRKKCRKQCVQKHSILIAILRKYERVQEKQRRLEKTKHAHNLVNEGGRKWCSCARFTPKIFQIYI